MAEYIDIPTTDARRRRPSTLGRIEERSLLLRLDWVLLLTSCALVAFGLWAIGGITKHVIQGTRTTTSRARSSSPSSARWRWWR